MKYSTIQYNTISIIQFFLSILFSLSQILKLLHMRMRVDANYHHCEFSFVPRLNDFGIWYNRNEIELPSSNFSSTGSSSSILLSPRKPLVCHYGAHKFLNNFFHLRNKDVRLQSFICNHYAAFLYTKNPSCNHYAISMQLSYQLKAHSATVVQILIHQKPDLSAIIMQVSYPLKPLVCNQYAGILSTKSPLSFTF